VTLAGKSDFASCKRIAACLAIAILLFATSVGLWHRHDSNSPDSEATCQICHIAHHQVLVQPQASAHLPQPIVFARTVSPLAPVVALDLATLHDCPRAPPAA